MNIRFKEIQCFEPLNEVDENQVNEIAESIKANGFIGCPILIIGDDLLTGSHRLMALRKLAEDENIDTDIENMCVAEDVTEIVGEAIKRFEEENGYTRDIELDNIGWLFKGTWVEKYRDEIKEW